MSKKKQIEVNKKIKEDKEDSIIEYINKTYGDNKIFKLPEKNKEYNPKDFIPTGSKCLNYIISGSYKLGVPRRKAIELYGPESVGKTTLALHIALEATKQKYKVLDCDTERGLNEFYAKNLGIDNKLFYYYFAENGEESFTIAEDLLEKFPWDVFIYDSVGGMKCRAIMENGYDDSNMGNNAKLMGKAITRLSKYFNKYNIAPIFINQIGSTIGGYGNPDETKGGKTLKYYLWCRLEIRAPRGNKIEMKVKMLQKGTLDEVVDEETIKENKKFKKKKEKKEKVKSETVETGTIITVKSVKNKLFMPRRTCRIKIDYGYGIDKNFDLLEYMDMRNLVKRFGEHKIIYNEKSIMNDNFIKKYNNDIEFKNRIDNLIEEDSKKEHLIIDDKNFKD
jgi:protein RecA